VRWAYILPSRLTFREEELATNQEALESDDQDSDYDGDGAEDEDDDDEYVPGAKIRETDTPQIVKQDRARARTLMRNEKQEGE